MFAVPGRIYKAFAVGTEYKGAYVPVSFSLSQFSAFEVGLENGITPVTSYVSDAIPAWIE